MIAPADHDRNGLHQTQANTGFLARQLHLREPRLVLSPDLSAILAQVSKSSPGRKLYKPLLHGVDGLSATEGQGPHQAPVPPGAGEANIGEPSLRVADSSRQPVNGLLLKIYEPVMKGDAEGGHRRRARQRPQEPGW